MCDKRYSDVDLQYAYKTLINNVNCDASKLAKNAYYILRSLARRVYSKKMLGFRIVDGDISDKNLKNKALHKLVKFLIPVRKQDSLICKHIDRDIEAQFKRASKKYNWR
jgi:hypothetical protein